STSPTTSVKYSTCRSRSGVSKVAWPIRLTLSMAASGVHFVPAFAAGKARLSPTPRFKDNAFRPAPDVPAPPWGRLEGGAWWPASAGELLVQLALDLAGARR